jgi:hypothetical protein
MCASSAGVVVGFNRATSVRFAAKQLAAGRKKYSVHVNDAGRIVDEPVFVVLSVMKFVLRILQKSSGHHAENF